jgi:hypothetical protein
MSQGVEKEKEEPEYELKVLERLKETMSVLVEGHRRRIDLVRGIALGLLYGIIGNLFVQHWYPVFEGLVLGKYDLTFSANVIVSASVLIVILYTTIIYHRQLTKEEEKENKARGDLEVLEKAIQRRKARLESLSVPKS